ncbi:hypothetical protein AX17_001198 [Amanita inopinata Kibby_2008]|nr:hypothetical protein AX17_001198 [Amanita inopinata Kibby_2008]
MSILGIGVDVVHVPRIVALIRRRDAQKLASRILSSKEVSQWNSLPADCNESGRARFLAVRWCAKEAGYKAMFPIESKTLIALSSSQF